MHFHDITRQIECQPGPCLGPEPVKIGEQLPGFRRVSGRRQIFPQMLEEIAVVRPGGPAGLALGLVGRDERLMQRLRVARDPYGVVVQDVVQRDAARSGPSISKCQAW
jgi:hypothetical protein